MSWCRLLVGGLSSSWCDPLPGPLESYNLEADFPCMSEPGDNSGNWSLLWSILCSHRHHSACSLWEETILRLEHQGESITKGYPGASLAECLVCVFSHLVVSDSSQPHGLWPTRLLSPWGFSRKEYWGGFPCPPPGGLPNPGLSHCRRILYRLSYQGSSECLML